MLELEALGQTLEGRCRRARCLSPGRGAARRVCVCKVHRPPQQAGLRQVVEASRATATPRGEGQLVPLSFLSGERLPSLHRCLDGTRAWSRQVRRKGFLFLFF